MNNYSTGNTIVDTVGKINISGNVIPMAWFKTIKLANNKPNVNAIMLLSDIVYWYRPTEVRDEATGQVVGTKKKFKEDFLQRSYNQISEQFGFTKRQISTALSALQELGVLKKHFRNLNIKGQKVTNVLYIELVPEKLLELTYPSEDNNQSEENDTTYNVGGTTLECNRSIHSSVEGTTYNVTPPTLECDTNTKNTTENNLGDYHINLSEQSSKDNKDEMDKIDKINAYTKIIKSNIDYDILKFDLKDDIDKLDEILDLLVETVSLKRKNIRISGADYPFELVKGKLLKLDSSHIKYVIDSLSNTKTNILNIKNYLLTALYNAPNTINNYYSAKVNHDMYNYINTNNTVCE